jgi:UDP-N-acetylmuramate: L-alanyl-gamma-D-glutamyl-meso-diaminopimelate ligase
MNIKPEQQRVHFIAIGGAIMHNLAIILKEKGLEVSGSDDEVFEPSRSRLRKHGLLPDREGWYPEIITKEIDFIILGMHARKDNPELLKAIDLGIKIYSYPEYVYELTKNKARVAVCGSHGKTTITAMVMHILNYGNYRFDYLVGSQLKGFDTMAGFREDSATAVFEGDEYLSSALDPRPKFLWYRPHICVISGIAWDHINVFPTMDDYISAFTGLVEMIEKGGTLIFYKHDKTLLEIINKSAGHLNVVSYDIHDHTIRDNQTFLMAEGREYPVSFFGNHNMQNFNAAMQICEKLGIEKQVIYKAIGSFEGASRRLQQVASAFNSTVFYDFAHSPSKLSATVNSVKEQYPSRKLVACMELHTFSSLNPEYINEYAHTMDNADVGIIYFDPEIFSHKKLKPFSEYDIKKAFVNKSLKIFTDRNDFINFLEKTEWEGKNLIFMSSGNLSGIDIPGLANKLLNK